MSLVPWSDSAGVGFAKMDGDWETTPRLGLTFGIILLSLVVLRGVASLLVDAYKFAKTIWGAKFADAATQTEDEGFRLPANIYINPQSDVYHCDNCRHVGVRAVSKRACNLCRNVE